MSGFVSTSANADLRPSGCVICGDPDTGWGALCRRHQGIAALSAWVDEGLMSDWEPAVGSELLNHRTMLIQPPVGPLDSVGRRREGGWLDQLAVIVRRFGYWLGLDGRGDVPDVPDDPWPGLPL